MEITMFIGKQKEARLSSQSISFMPRDTQMYLDTVP